MHQNQRESLHSFLARFNKEALNFDSTGDHSKIMAVINGLLTESDFLHYLFWNNLAAYVDLMAEAQKFIGAEEIFKAREASRIIQIRRSERKGREQVQTPQGDRRKRSVCPRIERQAPLYALTTSDTYPNSQANERKGSNVYSLECSTL